MTENRRGSMGSTRMKIGETAGSTHTLRDESSASLTSHESLECVQDVDNGEKPDDLSPRNSEFNKSEIQFEMNFVNEENNKKNDNNMNNPEAEVGGGGVGAGAQVPAPAPAPAPPPLPCPRNLQELAQFILSDKCQSIAFFIGSGASNSSGMPTVRSNGRTEYLKSIPIEEFTATPEQRELFEKDISEIVSKDMFYKNPLPYLEYIKPFILGTQRKQWKATIVHRFIELLQIKFPSKLCRCYSQNVDGLSKQCSNIPPEKLLLIHGSIGEAVCLDCKEPMDFDVFCHRMQTQIKDVVPSSQKHLFASSSSSSSSPSSSSSSSIEAPKESTPIVCPACTEPLVKPNTVLMGGYIKHASSFTASCAKDLPNLDLLFICGTSLSVAPSNTIVEKVPSNTIRVIVNAEEGVGRKLGIEYGPFTKRDYFEQGECDPIFLQLIQELGWLQDFQKLIDGTDYGGSPNPLPPASERLFREAVQRQGA